MTSTVQTPGTHVAGRLRAVQPTGRVFSVLLLEQLRERRLTPLTWGAALGAMGALIVLVWPSIQATVGDLIASYPKELMKAFGITGFNTIEQYVDGELFGLMIPFAAALLAVRSVLRPIVGAEDAGQLDTWLTMPIPRRTLAWSTFAAAGVLVAGTLLVMWLITMAVSLIAGAGLSGAALSRAVVNVWPVSMAFAGCAVVAAGTTRRPGRANGAVMGVLVAMYLVDLLGKLTTDLADLRYVSAFRYYGSAIEHGLDAGHIATLTAAALLLAVVGAELFERRDV